jgi:hypothetical protein
VEQQRGGPGLAACRSGDLLQLWSLPSSSPSFPDRLLLLPRPPLLVPRRPRRERRWRAEDAATPPILLPRRQQGSGGRACSPPWHCGARAAPIFLPGRRSIRSGAAGRARRSFYGGAGGNCRRLMRDDEGKLLEASFPSSSWIVSLLSSSGDADRASAGVSLRIAH